MTWYIILGFLLSLIMVLYLYNRKPNVVKKFKVAYAKAYHEGNSEKDSLIIGINSITHIQPFNQLNKHDIDDLATQYTTLAFPVPALAIMLESVNRFGGIDILKC